eukprot:scaffold42683_cov60-Phaeocystis_antarctica.AAC.4
MCSSCMLKCLPSACLAHSLSISSASASTCSASFACTSLLPRWARTGVRAGDSALGSGLLGGPGLRGGGARAGLPCEE